jgi:hypothetical protein
MIRKIADTLNWLPHYLGSSLQRRLAGPGVGPKHIHFAICDHFEPYWGKADAATARRRLHRWLDEYPKVADRHRDADGEILKYSFFYPEEEYRREDLTALAGLCHAGYGEVEIHLHHDNDTADNLRRTLLDFKKRLHQEHGLLSVDRETGEVSYGFIHGNWALCNSRADGRWCGVNEELSILQKTSCYADFTLPSAPSETQTRKVNSIYYAVDSQRCAKSHDTGVDAAVGRKEAGLLMVQGPLVLNWRRRKFGLLPRIENGGLTASNPITPERVRIWCGQGICVQGAAEHIFVKVYTHGTQEKNMQMFFDEKGLETLLALLASTAAEMGASLHFVSAREMVNIVHALEEGCGEEVGRMRDWRYAQVREPALKAEGA